MSEKIDRGILRWFGHVERMGDERLVKKVYESDTNGTRSRGRPRRRWMDEVQDCVRRKGLTIQEAKVSVQDRNEWRTICRGDGRAAGGPPAR